MSDLATRLREHVDSAAPPIDVEALVEMLQQEPVVAVVPPARRRFPDWALAFVVAAVVLAVVGGVALFFSGGGAVEPADTIAPPTTVPQPSVESGPVFELGTDDLCSWFTPEDMNRIVATAQARAGTDFAFIPFDETYTLTGVTTLGWCSWQPDLDRWQWATSRDPEPESFIYLDMWSAPSFHSVAGGERALSESFTRHEMLGEEVTYRVHGYNASFDAGLAVYLRVEGHEDDIIVFTLSVRDPDARGTPKYEDLGLAVANELLIEIGWIAPGSDTVDTTTPPADTVPRPEVKATTVYDLATDNLCEWLTAEEMDQIVVYAQQRAGTSFELGSLADPVPDRESCNGSSGLWWGSAGWTESPLAAEGAILISFHSYFAAPAYVDLDWFDEHPDWFERHWLLNDAVGYHVSRNTVAFDAGVQIQLLVDGQDDVLVFAFGVGDEAAVATPKYEELGLAIANELLRQMNWIDD